MKLDNNNIVPNIWILQCATDLSIRLVYSTDFKNKLKEICTIKPNTNILKAYYHKNAKTIEEYLSRLYKNNYKWYNPIYLNLFIYLLENTETSITIEDCIDNIEANIKSFKSLNTDYTMYESCNNKHLENLTNIVRQLNTLDNITKKAILELDNKYLVKEGENFCIKFS